MEYKAEGKDAEEEHSLVLQDEKHYQEVRSKVLKSLESLPPMEPDELTLQNIVFSLE